MQKRLLFALGVAAACAATPPSDPFAAARWEIAVPRPGVSLRGIAVVDDQVAWASGSRGTVLRTIDGGAHWSLVGPRDSEALDFRDVEATDRDHAVVCSTTDPARVYWTANGGDTWVLAHEDYRKGAFFDAMAFFDAQHGFLFGDAIDGRLQLHRTADGGQHWQTVAAPVAFAAAPGEGGFAASGTCAIAIDARRGVVVTGGARSRALCTLDAGDTWSEATLPLLAGRPTQGAFSVAFFDAQRGVVVGGDYEDQTSSVACVATTPDGGCTWNAVPAQVCYRSAVTCLGDGRTCIAVGQGGASVSTDAGATWRQLGDVGFHAITSRGDLVLAVGTGGRIGRLVRGQP